MIKINEKANSWENLRGQHFCDVCEEEIKDTVDQAAYLLSFYGSNNCIILCSKHAKNVLDFIRIITGNRR